MALNELLARFNLVAHKLGHGELGRGGVLDAHLQQRARLGLHRGFPKLFGVHLAQTLVALHVVFIGIVAQLGHELVFSLVVEQVLQDFSALGILLFQTVQRRLRDIDVAAADQVGHVAIEERQQQAANMRAVNIGIGHDDDAVVASGVAVVVFADIGPDRGNQAGNGVTGKRAMKARALHVEDFAAQGQDGLILAIASLLGRTTCGIALYNEDFGQRGVFARAVGKLARHAEAVEHALAARHFASLARRLASLERLRGLADDALCGRGVLFKVLGERFGHRTLHQTANLGVAQLGLGLALELRIVQLHANDGSQAFSRIVTGEIVVLLLEDTVSAGVFVDGARERILEAVEMRAALVRVDIVGKRHHAA